MSSFLKIEIPNEWEIKKLKDCASINPENLNINEINEDHINYIDIASIDNSTFQIKEVKKIPISDIPSRARRVIKENDVIISTVRPYLKAFSKVNKEQDNFICSTGFAVLRAKKGLNYEYLFQWILNQIFVNYMISQMIGSSYPAVNMSDVKTAPIIIPPLNEQIRISSILSNVDISIIKTQKIIDNLQVLKKGLMQRLFTEGIGHTEFKETRLGNIPKEWEIVTFSKIGKVIGGGTPDTRTEKYWNGHITWATPTDITNLNRKFIAKTNRNISIEGLNNSSAKLLPPFSLLMTSRASIGYCAINTREMCTNQGFQNIIPNKDIDVEFLYYLIQSSKLQNQLVRFAYGSTFLEIPNKDAKKIKIPLPKLDEQKKIISILSSLDKKMMKEYQDASFLKKIKKGLMQDLLTGKKRVKIN